MVYPALAYCLVEAKIKEFLNENNFDDVYKVFPVIL